MKLYTFDKKKNKNVLCGEYNEKDSTFIRKVSNKHFMIIERGYGIQEEILQELNRLNCKSIIIVTKTGKIVSTLEDWFKKSIKDYGHGYQRFLGGVR